MKKSKQIKITDGDNNIEYTLEYNREALSQMESWGFVHDEFLEKPATMLPLAFRGAFYMHHSNAKIVEIDKLFDEIKDRKGLTRVLADMMNDCYLSLINGEGKEEEKKVSWEIVE